MQLSNQYVTGADLIVFLCLNRISPPYNVHVHLVVEIDRNKFCKYFSALHLAQCLAYTFYNCLQYADGLTVFQIFLYLLRTLRVLTCIMLLSLSSPQHQTF